MPEQFYLKSSVFIEPLVNQWYAYGNLFPPHTHAMIIANLQQKIMESYLRSPSMHAAAVRNPKMLGGPFIDLPAEQSHLVKELMERTQREEADMFKLAESIRALDTLLSSEAKGLSLETLYERIPEALRGFVELGYDLKNQASMRFFERSLYRSSYFRTSRQAIRLSTAQGDDRAFVLSTPRFPDDRHVHLQVPFSSPALDRMFAMRFKPAALSTIEELIPEDPGERALFIDFFTQQAPALRPAPRAELGDQVRVRYYGHAVLLIENRDLTIMTDPIVSYAIPNQEVPRFAFEDLPEVIDYVLITHNHQDHIVWETLLPLRHRIGTIVVPPNNGGQLQDPSIKLFLQQSGFPRVIELDEFEELPVAGGAITGVPFLGEHGDLHIRSKLAYHIRLGEQTMMCAADSNNLVPEIYDQVHQHLGKVKRVFVGMECAGAPMSWLYGQFLTTPLDRKQDQGRRLNGSDSGRALRMLESLGAEEAYIYAMGQEPWLKFISSIAYTASSPPIVESDKVIDALKTRGKFGHRLFGREEIFCR